MFTTTNRAKWFYYLMQNLVLHRNRNFGLTAEKQLRFPYILHISRMSYVDTNSIFINENFYQRTIRGRAISPNIAKETFAAPCFWNQKKLILKMLSSCTTNSGITVYNYSHKDLCSYLPRSMYTITSIRRECFKVYIVSV